MNSDITLRDNISDMIDDIILSQDVQDSVDVGDWNIVRDDSSPEGERCYIDSRRDAESIEFLRSVISELSGDDPFNIPDHRQHQEELGRMMYDTLLLNNEVRQSIMMGSSYPSNEVSEAVKNRIVPVPFNPEVVCGDVSDEGIDDEMRDVIQSLNECEESMIDSIERSGNVHHCGEDSELDVHHCGEDSELDVHQEIINESMDEMTTSLCVLFIICSIFTLFNVSGRTITEQITTLRLSATSISFMILIAMSDWKNITKISSIPVLWLMTSLLVHQ